MLDYNFHITTPRLTLSYLNPANSAHYNFALELTNSPEVMYIYRHLSTTPKTQEEIESRLEMNAISLETTGYGRYLISRRPDDAATANNSTDHDHVPFSESINSHDFIGIVSLNYARFPSAPTIPDLGFSIMAKYYGKGYATEASQGLMKYYREEKGQTAFAGYTDPDNEKSMKLFQRLGFELRGERALNGVFGDIPGAALPRAIWTLGAEGELEEYGL